MQVLLRTTVTSTADAPKSAIKRFKRLLEDLAEDMGDQVRINIIKAGNPGGQGGWKPVDGWNEVAKGKARKDVKAKNEGNQARQRNAAHSGYALRKNMGKTPGHDKFKADEMLRDTEALFESLGGVVSQQGGSWFITLHADGSAPGRQITNQRLLEIHSLGEGNMPKRDPTDQNQMRNYEERVKRRLEEFLDKAFGASA